MAEEQESQQRSIARRKMREAIDLFEGRHPEQGVEAMREVVEIDPEFIAPRKWLADYYVAADEKHRAISQYEDMLRIEPENDELWEELRSIDPTVADRLRRLSDLPPDPFVAQRADADLDDLDDFEAEDEEEEEEAEAVAAPFAATAADDIVADGDEEFVEEAASDYEPLAWEHEQEAEYREQLDRIPGFVDVWDGLALFWADPQGWSRLLGQCSAPEDAHWPELDNLVTTAAGSLHGPPPDALVLYQHTRMPLALPMRNSTLVVGEPYRTALSHQELLFFLGAGVHGLMNENAQYTWACEHIIGREPDDCELRLNISKAAEDFTVGWDDSVPRDEVGRLARICHAWEQRAALSADRAGMLACGNIEAASRAIAAMCSEPGEASMVSTGDFLAQFEDVPAGELAAVGLAHDPWTDPQYAAYRIQMLQWWVTTDEYDSLAHG